MVCGKEEPDEETVAKSSARSAAAAKAADKDEGEKECEPDMAQNEPAKGTLEFRFRTPKRRDFRMRAVHKHSPPDVSECEHDDESCDECDEACFRVHRPVDW